ASKTATDESGEAVAAGSGAGRTPRRPAAAEPEAADDTADAQLPARPQRPATGTDAAAKKKFCTECGKPLQPGAKFCPNCGAEVVWGRPRSIRTVVSTQANLAPPLTVLWPAPLPDLLLNRFDGLRTQWVPLDLSEPGIEIEWLWNKSFNGLTERLAVAFCRRK